MILMKSIPVLLLLFIFFSCSKDKTYSDFNLKDGEIVTLLVDHKFGSRGNLVYRYPQLIPGEIHLFGFLDREPGYNYHIKAKMVVPNLPPQDGPSYHLEFLNVEKKEKYLGNETFEIPLILGIIPGGPFINMHKEEGKYLFSNKVTLNFTAEDIGEKLEEIWQHKVEVDQVQKTLKWKSITLTVNHDPSSFGQAYIVSKITVE